MTESFHYLIELKGRINADWSSWFDNMKMSYQRGNTFLKGPVADISALHGILNKIRDLNFELISLNRIPTSGKDGAINELQKH